MIYFLILQIFVNGLEPALFSTKYPISEIKNERNCNASHIFASLSAFESAYAVFTNSTQITNFSEQLILSSFLIDCSRGTIKDVLDFMKNQGNVIESAYPYFGKKIYLPNNSEVPVTLPYYFNYTVNNASSFNSILANYPLIVGFSIDDTKNFSEYSGGVYACNNQPGDIHYMLAVYNDTAYRSGFFYFKKNWGSG